jgi:hypothetical protein
VPCGPGRLPSRSATNARRAPSGDQDGYESLAGCVVRFRSQPPSETRRSGAEGCWSSGVIARISDNEIHEQRAHQDPADVQGSGGDGQRKSDEAIILTCELMISRFDGGRMGRRGSYGEARASGGSDCAPPQRLSGSGPLLKGNRPPEAARPHRAATSAWTHSTGRSKYPFAYDRMSLSIVEILIPS